MYRGSKYPPLGVGSRRIVDSPWVGAAWRNLRDDGRCSEGCGVLDGDEGVCIRLREG